MSLATKIFAHVHSEREFNMTKIKLENVVDRLFHQVGISSWVDP